ncbi:Uncharacterised protein [Mycobacterium tuberculosis]|nr:Uncharacterised protein [Mycobacterium tuberculosis]
MSATVYSDCRRRPRRPALRRGDRGGRRSGAPRRAAAARAPGVAGARAGPFFRVRADGGRAADRRGGRGRRGVSGRNRRPVVYRGFRRACWPHRGAGRRCAVSVAAVDPPTCHRAEPVRAGPGRPDGSVVEDGDSHHRTVRRAVSYRRGVQVRCRRGGRAPVRPRRTGTGALRAGAAAGSGRRAGMRSADRPGRRRGVRRALAGRRAASGADGRRSGLHPAGHSCRHRQRRRAQPGVAVRRAADRGRHRRPGALATGRVVEQPECSSPAHRGGDSAAAAGGGDGVRIGRLAVAAMGRAR